jgi:hypothetical protein
MVTMKASVFDYNVMPFSMKNAINTFSKTILTKCLMMIGKITLLRSLWMTLTYTTMIVLITWNTYKKCWKNLGR